jgi:hypothetical protein
MSHLRVVLVTVLSILFVHTPASAQSERSPLLPPQSNVFGLSFDEWNVLQTQFAIETQLGGKDVSPIFQHVQFLPGAIFGTGPIFNVTLRAGTPFVSAPLFLFGERYDDPNVPDDDPVALAELIDAFVQTAGIETVFDGRVLLNGDGSQFEHYMFGPTFFDAPVAYAQPQDRGGGLNAVAALWVVGIGSVYHSLEVGQHTLVYTLNTVLGDSHFTYNITVVP